MKSVEAKHQPYKDLSFFADSMHGSLARKLRVFGMDTAYISSISDEHLLRECIHQRRILLTSDKELFKRSMYKRIRSVLLRGRSDKENIVKILRECNIREILFDPTFARCPTCNIELEKKRKGEIDESNGLIPAKSYLLNSSFYQCSGCMKLYWEGSHKPAFVSLANSVKLELDRISEVI